MADDESIRRTVQDLLREVQNARTDIARADNERAHVLSELRTETTLCNTAVAKLDRISAEMASKVAKLQSAFNALAIKAARPGAGGDFSEETERASARGLLELKHLLKVPKHDLEHPFAPTEEQIDEALLAR